jgi:hypothetical protein
MNAWEAAAGPTVRRQGSRFARPAPPARGLDRIEVAEKEVRIMGSNLNCREPWSPPKAKNQRLSAFAVLY